MSLNDTGFTNWGHLAKRTSQAKKKSELKKSKANESQLNRSVDHVDVYQTTQIKNQNRDGMGNFVG